MAYHAQFSEGFEQVTTSKKIEVIPNINLSIIVL